MQIIGSRNVLAGPLSLLKLALPAALLALVLSYMLGVIVG